MNLLLGELCWCVCPSNPRPERSAHALSITGALSTNARPFTSPSSSPMKFCQLPKLVFYYVMIILPVGIFGNFGSQWVTLRLFGKVVEQNCNHTFCSIHEFSRVETQIKVIGHVGHFSIVVLVQPLFQSRSLFCQKSSAFEIPHARKPKALGLRFYQRLRTENLQCYSGSLAKQGSFISRANSTLNACMLFRSPAVREAF
jgi:hypothetical protein